jgi:hypothetical protein
MAKGRTVVDEVLGNIGSPLPQCWHERIAPEHVETLREIREAWSSGRLGSKKQTAARAIAKTLNDRGIAKVGPQGVIAWLERA